MSGEEEQKTGGVTTAPSPSRCTTAGLWNETDRVWRRHLTVGAACPTATHCHAKLRYSGCTQVKCCACSKPRHASCAPPTARRRRHTLSVAMQIPHNSLNIVSEELGIPELYALIALELEFGHLGADTRLSRDRLGHKGIAANHHATADDRLAAKDGCA